MSYRPAAKFCSFFPPVQNFLTIKPRFGLIDFALREAVLLLGFPPLLL